MSASPGAVVRARAEEQGRPAHRLVVAVLLALVGSFLVLPAPVAQAACSGNAIVCENELPGTPQRVWNIEGAGDQSIQGFATRMSVDTGSRVDFKIDTNARAYTVPMSALNRSSA